MKKKSLFAKKLYSFQINLYNYEWFDISQNIKESGIYGYKIEECVYQ